MKKRVFLIVLDSFGIGELPDAKKYGDENSNTLKSITESKFFSALTLTKLGLFNIDGNNYYTKNKTPISKYCKIQELSRGKDTTTGHFEMAGIISKKPFPVFKNGFPNKIVEKLEKAFNSKILCNKPYSGTEVIKDFGQEHIKTKCPIVYTSADSVLQIACHEDIVPLETLYSYCEKARKIMTGKYEVGRIIARPFVGSFPNFIRTKNRHDFSVVPPKNNLLEILQNNNLETIGVGKIGDIFANTSLSSQYKTTNNLETLNKVLELQQTKFNGLCFVNLCDFDMLYGHRNDVDGYAKAISEADEYIGKILKNIKKDDVLIITADHGCDPKTPSTDHSREYVPCLIYHKNITPQNLGTQKGFNRIGATVLDIFNIKQKENKNLAKKYSLLKKD